MDWNDLTKPPVNSNRNLPVLENHNHTEIILCKEICLNLPRLFPTCFARPAL